MFDANIVYGYMTMEELGSKDFQNELNYCVERLEKCDTVDISRDGYDGLEIIFRAIAENDLMDIVIRKEAMWEEEFQDLVEHTVVWKKDVADFIDAESNDYEV